MGSTPGSPSWWELGSISLRGFSKGSDTGDPGRRLVSQPQVVTRLHLLGLQKVKGTHVRVEGSRDSAWSRAVTGALGLSDGPSFSPTAPQTWPDGRPVWTMREERTSRTREVTPERAPDVPASRNDATGLHVLVHPAVRSCRTPSLHQPAGPHGARPPPSAR